MDQRAVFTFEQLPHAMSLLYSEMQDIKELLRAQNLSQTQVKKPKNIQEAAAFLELAVPTVYALVSRGEIPYFKKSKRLYFDEELLAEWVKTGRKKTNAEIAASTTSRLVSKNKRG